MRRKWIILAVILAVTLTLAMGCGKDEKAKVPSETQTGRAEIREDMQDLREDMRDTVQDTMDRNENRQLEQDRVNEDWEENEVGRWGSGLFGMRRS